MLARVEDFHFVVGPKGIISVMMELILLPFEKIRYIKVNNLSQIYKKDIRYGDHLRLTDGEPVLEPIKEYRIPDSPLMEYPESCPCCGETLSLELERRPQFRCEACTNQQDSESDTMITDVAGSMFYKAPKGGILGIPVNTDGVAGKGIALYMKLAFNKTFEQYVRACRRGQVASGDLLAVDERGFTLAILPTKYEWRKPSDLGLIEVSLTRLREYLVSNLYFECHLPRLGCGKSTGQLDYETEVKPVIERVFANTNIKVYVYDWTP